MSSAFLEEMAAGSRERVRSAKATRSAASLESEVRARLSAPPLRLSDSGFDVIAEVKLRSPAAGALRTEGDDLVARVRGYAKAGAAAISVLTEPKRFDGSLADLHRAAEALATLRVPALRKDFLVDPYQLLEARAAGAGGVLIILRMLSRSEIDALLDCACALELFVLLESFDADDIALVHELVEAHRGSNPLLAGVNCRDLVTLEVVPQRLLELAPLLPAAVPKVAESGVTTAEDAARVAAAGYELVLVGSALMKSGDPQSLVRALLAAGRAARRNS